MNDNALTEDDLMQLEALVDGELPEIQYSRLLSRLDQLPEGWKVCALTFLEHQALEREIRDLTWTQLRVPDSRTPASSLTLEVSLEPKPQGETCRMPFSKRPWIQSFSMLAASIVLAFTAGFSVSQYRWNRSVGEHEDIAVSLPAKVDSLDSALDHVEQALTNQVASEGLSPDQLYDIDAPASEAFPSIDNWADKPTRNAELIDNPLLESKERKIVRMNSLVDAEMERVQSFVPYTREDGQEIVVPVQNLKFRPIAVHGF